MGVCWAAFLVETASIILKYYNNLEILQTLMVTIWGFCKKPV